MNRKLHYWGACVCILPVMIMIGSGLLLLLKGESDWVQPATVRGQAGEPSLSMDTILRITRSIEQMEVSSWSDINRLDVRPSKGVIKVRGNNHWELQLDHISGESLQLAYRRSDTIESIHDGTFFADWAKLWLFLPASLILMALSMTGVYLFVQPMMARRRKRLRLAARA